MSTISYRYPNEILILTITLILVLAVIALTAIATVCGSVIFVAAMVALSYLYTRSHHQSLMTGAQQINHTNAPGLAALIRDSASRLKPGPFEAYVVPENVLNAYTFGLSSPKVVVLYAGLLKVMDEDELRFVVGHEMGHICLGHTWLNSLVGGIAGIPSPSAASALLALAFMSWNRACEFSADRAGMLACGKPEKAISALVKLVAAKRNLSTSEMERYFKRFDAEDDNLLSDLSELLATHPMTIHRIEQLRRYAASAEYKHLAAQMNR
ncbi:MAG: M48 family metallopeptidase [Anaerolineales bacterium]|nr:M48 family metallopeptidase [Anaerolineales bacterium]